jgi:predicted N-acetyltransferase YhbS
LKANVAKMDNMNSNQFARTTLAENPEYFEEVIALVEREFHYSTDSRDLHYEKDFALSMDPLNFENCYLYIDKSTNAVVSHLAVSLRTMIKNNQKIKVALIGGIATAKDYRGRDLFKSLMNYALEKHSEECGLFILWSEITGLYEKFDFHLSGGLIQTGEGIFSATERPAGFEKTTFSELSAKDYRNIQNIYSSFNEKYFFTMVREEKEWSIIKEMNSIDLYLKRNSSGVIEQYFCVNKGRDLSNIIHEIGCVPDQYLSLIKLLQKFKTWIPETEASLSPKKDIFFSAFLRLGNIKSLNSFLKEISQSELLIVSLDKNEVTFKYRLQEITCSQQEFLQYLFGPKPLKEFESFLLSPYITGTDSI